MQSDHLNSPSRDHRLAVVGEHLVLKVLVDGRLATVHVPAQTLFERFGTLPDPRSWIHAYRQHAARINHAAIRKGRRVDASSFTLQTADLSPSV